MELKDFVEKALSELNDYGATVEFDLAIYTHPTRSLLIVVPQQDSNASRIRFSIKAGKTKPTGEK